VFFVHFVSSDWAILNLVDMVCEYVLRVRPEMPVPTLSAVRNDGHHVSLGAATFTVGCCSLQERSE